MRVRYLLGFILIFFSVSPQASLLYPLQTDQQEAQFNHLLHSLRCLVCQNQDLADSNASLALDLRREVYERVKRGQSSHEIRNFLTERYGDFILFDPPVETVTVILWFAPAIFLSIGLFIVWRRSRIFKVCE